MGKQYLRMDRDAQLVHPGTETRKRRLLQDHLRYPSDLVRLGDLIIKGSNRGDVENRGRGFQHLSRDLANVNALQNNV